MLLVLCLHKIIFKLILKFFIVTFISISIHLNKTKAAFFPNANYASLEHIIII